MTKEEAELYAKNMTYRDALYNLMQAKSIPYKKATFIKIHQLLDLIEPDDRYESYHCSNTSSDYVWILCLFATLFSDLGNIKLTDNEMNNITMLMLKE